MGFLWALFLMVIASAIPLSVGGVVYYYKKSNRPIDARAIQFIAIGTIIPTLLILSLEEYMNMAVIALIFGLVIGYFFRLDKNA